MLRSFPKSVLVLAVLAAAGCASVPGRDAVMEDARVSVNAARSNPMVTSYAPAELNQAVVTLRQADDLAARGGRTSEVDQLAMLANQRAGLAQEAAQQMRTAGFRTRGAGLPTNISNSVCYPTDDAVTCAHAQTVLGDTVTCGSQSAPIERFALPRSRLFCERHPRAM